MNKIDGFSKLHNIQFEQKGIRVWRSYGIGRGKEIPFDQLVSQGQESTCLVITSNFLLLKIPVYINAKSLWQRAQMTIMIPSWIFLSARSPDA